MGGGQGFVYTIRRGGVDGGEDMKGKGGGGKMMEV